MDTNRPVTKIVGIGRRLNDQPAVPNNVVRMEPPQPAPNRPPPPPMDVTAGGWEEYRRTCLYDKDGQARPLDRNHRYVLRLNFNQLLQANNAVLKGVSKLSRMRRELIVRYMGKAFTVGRALMGSEEE